MQPQRRVARFQPAEQPFVEVDFQSGVQAALQQQLVAAQTERAVDFFAVLLHRGDERPVGLVGFAVEVAELAARNADVGDVDVAVDLPRHDLRIGNHGAAHLVGHQRQLLQRGFVVEPVGFFARERLPPPAFVVDALHGYRFLRRLLRRTCGPCPSAGAGVRSPSSSTSKSSWRFCRSARLTRMRTASPSVMRRPVERPMIW